jgi:Kef-type K+ transport system membrane component KefB
MIEVFTADLALIIITATVLAFLARKTGQPTIVAYIVTGLILGAGLNLVSETEMTSLFSELGLVFLLFLIGLEMDIKKIRDVLKPVTVIGFIQMALFLIVGFLVATVLGFSTVESLFIGAAIMFSSTALVVKLLTDKDQASEMYGKLDIGILLVQDVAVVVLFALISSGMGNPSAIILRFVEVIFLIAVISSLSIILSRYGLSKLFRGISSNQHTLFIFGIAWAFLFISTAEALNISTEIGAFVAGLGLAQLTYSPEIQERVRPLTDLFMAIFFINFGLSIVPSQLSIYLIEAAILAAILIPFKLLVFFFLIDRMGYSLETSFLGGINMTQTSEFSLILASIAVSNGLIGEGILGFVGVIAVTSMGISSYLIQYNERILEKLRPYIEKFESENHREIIEGELEDHAVIIGYDELARNVADELSKFFDQVAVVDESPENVEKLRKSDHKYIYGDIRHGEVRKKAALEKAEIVICFVQGLNLNKQVLRASDSDSTRIVRADSFEAASELYDMDAHYVIVKNMLSGDKLGEQLKLFLEDRELFLEEVEEERKKIEWRSRTWR